MASSLHKFQVALRLCEDHNQKELHAYCETCDKKICSSCIKGDHIQHDWELISDILREKKRTLPEECKAIRAKQLPDLRKEIDRFDRKIQKEDATLDQTISVLNSSRKSNIEEINKLFDDRIDECHQKHDEATQIYKDKRDALKQKVEYLEAMTSALDKDINTIPDHDILDMEKEMRDELEKALSYSADSYTCTTMYVPGQINTEALKKMIGKIHSVSVEEKNDIDKYSETIKSINTVSDTNAWIRRANDKFAKLLNRTGEELKTMVTPCDGISIMRSGEFVLLDERNCTISVLTKDENIIRIIDTKQLHPTCISKTENDDILVTLMDSGDPLTLSPASRRVVQRMTLKGKVLQIYEFREDDKTRLFTLPCRILESKNTDVCVVNMLNMHKGELVVLHKDGRVKFTYKGNGLKSEQFFPSDVLCDSKCCILLTEIYSRGIHILSAEGMYLCALCQYDQLNPWPISFYGDNLWCGFHDGRVKVLKYRWN